MKKTLITLSILFIFSVAVIPMPTLADTKAGLNPSHFFYFLDTGFEKINLFFTFNSEKKATKALEYAEERLAEAEEVANENETESVEKAMAGYEEKISLATEKSKEIKDEEKAEKSLKTVSESMAKHQIILEGVLEKVPQEAKEAIEKAIETSQKGYEQAMRQMAELKRENEQLKKDIEELKLNDEENENEIEEISEKSKDEIKQAEYETETAQAKAKAEKKTSIFTLPNGAVIEMDEYGNIVRTVKAASIIPTPKESENQYFKTLLPNGAIVEMDENGNIIKTIKEAPPTPETIMSLSASIKENYDINFDPETSYIKNIFKFNLKNTGNTPIEITKIIAKAEGDFDDREFGSITIASEYGNLFTESSEKEGTFYFETKHKDFLINPNESMDYIVKISTRNDMKNSKTIRISIAELTTNAETILGLPLQSNELNLASL